MAKVDIILYYDSYVREYDSLIRLKSELKRLNISAVILPNHFMRYYYSLKFRPKLVVLPFFYNVRDGNFRIQKNLNDPLFLNLHSEQIFNDDSRALLLPQDQPAKDVFHAVWGDRFRRALLEAGVADNLINITGNIRNDLIDKVKSTYRIDTVLFPSSFGMTMMPDQYIADVVKMLGPTAFKEQLDFMAKSRIIFFKNILRLAEEHKHVHFILRPHPHVDLSKFESTFIADCACQELPSNCRIEREGSIHEFIKGGDVVLAWHSTTALEAALSNRRVVIHAPLKFPMNMSMDYFDYFSIVETYEELDKALFSSDKNNKMVNKYISDVYFEIDGKSARRMANYIESLIVDFEDYPRRSVNLMFHYFIKMILVDFTKLALIKLNLLHRLFPFYGGLLEDRESDVST
ncbi:hypothetical protein N9579_06130 [Schleiferiaceae bacterium]|nr:hypothetical protein [Schleiferiaceae bacterium]